MWAEQFQRHWIVSKTLNLDIRTCCHAYPVDNNDELQTDENTRVYVRKGLLALGKELKKMQKLESFKTCV